MKYCLRLNYISIIISFATYTESILRERNTFSKCMGHAIKRVIPCRKSINLGFFQNNPSCYVSFTNTMSCSNNYGIEIL